MCDKIITGNIINLEKNVFRKEHIIKEFDNSQINLNFFKAIKHDKGWIGCLRSHLELIKFAKNNDMDMILVIEDDAKIEDREYFNQVFPKILDYLKNNKDKWEIFHGGPIINKFSKIHDYVDKELKLLKISKCSATTFVIYNSNIYDFFLKYYSFSDDKLKNSNKIDMIIYNNFNSLTTYPILVWQIDSYSDIYKMERNDLTKLKNASNVFFKRLLK